MLARQRSFRHTHKSHTSIIWSDILSNVYMKLNLQGFQHYRPRRTCVVRVGVPSNIIPIQPYSQLSRLHGHVDHLPFILSSIFIRVVQLCIVSYRQVAPRRRYVTLSQCWKTKKKWAHRRFFRCTCAIVLWAHTFVTHSNLRDFERWWW